MRSTAVSFTTADVGVGVEGIRTAREGDLLHQRVIHQSGAGSHGARENVGRTLTTPAGKPASSTRSANNSAAKGVSSDGFTTTVFPAAKAAGIFIVSEGRGPFHVMITPITPYGWARV